MGAARKIGPFREPHLLSELLCPDKQSGLPVKWATWVSHRPGVLNSLHRLDPPAERRCLSWAKLHSRLVCLVKLLLTPLALNFIELACSLGILWSSPLLL